MNTPSSIADLQLRMQQHAETLETEGAGDVSMMVRDSVFHTMTQRPDLPKIYAAESAKFTDMAYRIAPPELVAEYLHTNCALQLVTAALPPQSVMDVFRKMKAMTRKTEEGLSDDVRGKSTQFAYTPSEAASYYARCRRDPDLQLSCIHLSMMLQIFVAETVIKMKNRYPHGENIMNFGMQFNATNLVTAFPAALHICLERRHGAGAPLELLDKETVEDAMQFLHRTGQFSVTGKGRPDTEKSGESLVLRCPMEGWLHELVVKHNALLPVVKATQQLTANVRGMKVEEVDHDSIHAIHMHNANLISVFATMASAEMDKND